MTNNISPTMKVGVLVPGMVPTDNPGTQNDWEKLELSGRENEGRYLQKFGEKVTAMVGQKKGQVSLIAFNDLMESFRNEHEIEFQAFHSLHHLSRISKDGEASFNLNRFKSEFRALHSERLLEKKPNISARELEDNLRLRWQQFLDSGTDELSPRKGISGSEVHDYLKALSRLQAFLRQQESLRGVELIAGPGNYFNVDKYGVNENFNRHVLMEALRDENIPTLGVCGSEQSFLYHLGAKTVGRIQNHNYESQADQKTATSLVIGGTIMSDSLRANPDLPKRTVLDVAAFALESMGVQEEPVREAYALELKELIDKRLPGGGPFREVVFAALEEINAEFQNRYEGVLSGYDSVGGLVEAQLARIDFMLMDTNSIHTMAIEVCEATLKVIADPSNRMVVSSVSVASNREGLDIYQYLQELHAAAKRLANAEANPVDVDVSHLYRAHQTLRETVAWKHFDITLIVKSAERSGSKNPADTPLAPALLTQWHPEFGEPAGSVSEHWLSEAFDRARWHTYDKAAYDLDKALDQIAEMRMLRPGYFPGTASQGRIEKLVTVLDHEEAHNFLDSCIFTKLNRKLEALGFGFSLAEKKAEVALV